MRGGTIRGTNVDAYLKLNPNPTLNLLTPVPGPAPLLVVFHAHIHALTTLHSHGLCSETLHHVYRSVIIAKVLYASSIWWALLRQPIVNACKRLSNATSTLDFATPAFQLCLNSLALRAKHCSNALHQTQIRYSISYFWNDLLHHITSDL